jgi:hypothetical protein
MPSGLAAFAVSLPLWRIFCRSDRGISGRGGAIAGILVGLFAHPVTWYLTIVWAYTTGVRSSLGEPAANPVEAITGCFAFAFWSILLTGWVTMPAGGIVGWILGRVLRPAESDFAHPR